MLGLDLISSIAIGAVVILFVVVVASVLLRAEKLLILVAVTLIAAVSIFGFVAGIFGSFSHGISVAVDPQIYSPQQNIGVLNQNATFTVTVSSSLSSSVTGTTVISAGSQTVLTQGFSLLSGQSETYRLSTTLYTVGERT